VAAFGVEQFQNGGRCHGNQGTKWPPNTIMLRIDIHRWFDMVLGIG
jgi:hypothetical protein